jgi:opacity protein-like surface antigen
MRTLFIISTFAASAMFAHAAAAADNGLYVGASIGQSTTDLGVPGSVGDLFDEEDSGFKLMAGLRPLDWFGVEASYLDLGKVEQTRNDVGFADFEFDQKGYNAFGVFFLDIATFDLFAKAGLVRWDLDGSGTTLFGPADFSDDGTDFAWALGAQARFRSIAVRLEYERFQVKALDGLIEKPEMFSIGLTWTFF